MIASAIGRPSVPARTADSGLPPTATQTGSGFWIGRERGWPPLQRPDYDAAATLRGANFVGSPQQVVEKILFQHELFRHDRFLGQISVGDLPHRNVLRAIELFGTEVAPAVRAELAHGGSTGAQTSPGASS